MRDYLAAILAGANAKQPPGGMTSRVIAIDGLGGAGKSSLAERLAAELGGAPIVHTDDFASWDNPRDWWPRFVEEVLEPLARNETAHYRCTNWGPEDEERWGDVAPSRFVIIEGVSTSREAFRPFLTYAVWIETPRDLRLSRGLARDGDEARAQWELWMAEEDAYVTRGRPRDNVDLILPGDRDLWS